MDEVCLDGRQRLPLHHHRVRLVLVRRHQRSEPRPITLDRYIAVLEIFREKKNIDISKIHFDRVLYLEYTYVSVHFYAFHYLCNLFILCTLKVKDN